LGAAWPAVPRRQGCQWPCRCRARPLRLVRGGEGSLQSSRRCLSANLPAPVARSVISLLLGTVDCSSHDGRAASIACTARFHRVSARMKSASSGHVLSRSPPLRPDWAERHPVNMRTPRQLVGLVTERVVGTIDEGLVSSGRAANAGNQQHQDSVRLHVELKQVARALTRGAKLPTAVTDEDDIVFLSDTIVIMSCGALHVNSRPAATAGSHQH
jgi:hypothetical protein